MLRTCYQRRCPPYRELTGLSGPLRADAGGAGVRPPVTLTEITGVTDGAGQGFRLVLTTQAQRAEEARTSSLSSSDSSHALSASSVPRHTPVPNGPDRVSAFRRCG